MTRVGGLGAPMVPLRAGRAARGDGRFGATLDAAGQAGEAAPMAAAGALGAAAGLLSLQEVPDATARNRRARQGAQAALAGLRAMQLALLGGGLAREELEALAEAAGHAAAADDPALREAAQSIALRAAVELARLDAPRG